MGGKRGHFILFSAGMTFVMAVIMIAGLMLIPAEKVRAADTSTAEIKVDEKEYASFAEWMGTDSSKKNCSIKLLKDAALTQQLVLSGTVTLDLDGHNLNCSGTVSDYMLQVQSGNSNKLTITSSQPGGKITKDGCKSEGVLRICSYASCTIGGNVTIEDSSGVSIFNQGTLTVEAGVTICNMNQFDSGATIRNNGNATLNGGNYTGGKNIIMAVSNGKLTINDGNYNDKIQITSGDLILNGGTFNKSITLPGEQTLQDCMKQGYTLKAIEDGTDTIDMYSNSLTIPAKVVESQVYFTTHPSLAAEKASLLQGYAADDAATLTVEAKGKDQASVTYQWHVRKTPEGETVADEKISGATKASYSIPAGLTAGSYEYYCEASCNGETARSKSVTVTVTGGYVQTQIAGTRKNYTSLDEAWVDIENAVTSGTTEQTITLTFLDDITASTKTYTLDGTGKTAALTIDLNGKTVTCDVFDLKQVGVTLKDSTKAGRLNAALNMQGKSELTAADVTVKGITLASGVTAMLTDCTTSDIVAGSDSGSDATVNEGISCEINGGIHADIKVYGGAKLKVEGEATVNGTLQAIHHIGEIPVRAEVTLQGGDYNRIQISTSDDGLEDSSKRYAIVDMLAEGYAFYSLGMKATVQREETTYRYLSVCTADTPEDTSKAVVKLIIKKNDNLQNTYYFPGWTEALNLLREGVGADKWQEVELVLLKNAAISLDETVIDGSKLPSGLKLIIRSESNGGTAYTLNAGGKYVLKLQGFGDVSIRNITIEDGSIRLDGHTTLTLDDNAAISCSQSYPVWVYDSTLVMKEASIKSTGSVVSPVWLSAGQLRLESDKAYLSTSDWTIRQVRYRGYNNGIIVGATVDIPTIVGNTDTSELDIFCNNAVDGITGGDEGKVKEWYPITLPDSESADQLLKDNISTVKECDGRIYGLGQSSDNLEDRTIMVAGTICAYQVDEDDVVGITDSQFTMPAKPVALKVHGTDENGTCSYCNKTDLATAYQNGKLQINGLTGRTYDSWPQILTSITLDDATLQGPKYVEGRELAQNSRNTANASLTGVDYAVVYENNICAYDKEQGDTGFDASKAPKVIITGLGKYTGTVEYYFTIGQGTIDLREFTEQTDLVYNGRSQNVLQSGRYLYQADQADATAGLQVETENPGAIPVCTAKTVANNGFDSVADPKLTYSEDTFPDADEAGVSENGCYYWAKNAGNYEFGIQAKDGENALGEKSLAAVIQPKSLNDDSIEKYPRSYVAYYTGKAVMPEAKYDGVIQDANIGRSLEEDCDFTVAAENNIDITNEAKLIFTGKGNYTGTWETTFDITYCFELRQTSASKNYWYNNVELTKYPIDITQDVADSTDQLIYIESQRNSGSQIYLFPTLEEARNNKGVINGDAAAYTITGEGRISQVLYGADWNGDENDPYIYPVEVEVCIDKSAPVWADKDGKTAGYGIGVDGTWWSTKPERVQYGKFYTAADTLELVMQANDQKKDVNEVSGIDKYYYYVDKITDAVDSTTTKTKAELDAQVEENKFTAVDAGTGMTEVGADGVRISIPVTDAGSYIVYAYAVDKAGNQSDYICTDVLVRDTTAPEITMAETPSGDALKNTTAQISFTANEEGMYYYILKEAGETEPTREDIIDKTKKETLSGKTVWAAKDGVIRGEMSEGGNTITLADLTANTSYRLYLIAADQAGNVTEIATQSFTTLKMIPYVESVPVITGIYGTAVEEMMLDVTGAKVFAAKGSDTLLDGKWSLRTDKAGEIPVVGTQEKYTLIFTPTENIYDDVTCEVKPTVARKPVTVVIENGTRVYGADDPEFIWSIATGEGYTDNKLVTGDTEADLGIVLATTAIKTSEVGTYPITGTSGSANYAVSFIGNGSDGNSGVLTVQKTTNEFTIELSCSGYTYTKDKSPIPNAEAQFGAVTYKYAKAGSDDTAPADESAYTDTVPVNAGIYAVKAYVAETNNYAGLTSDPVVFMINKADKAPNMPETAMTPAHSNAKVSDIILPDGWNWQGSDGDKALEDEKEVTATAVYTGMDKGNYQTESVSITIVRSACTHPEGKREVKDVVEATCTQTGYSGNTYCTDCGALLQKGEVIESLGHTFTWVVDQPATEEVAGSKHEECGVCGYKKASVTINKLLAKQTESTTPEAASTIPEIKGTVVKEDKSGVTYTVTSPATQEPEVAYTAPENKKVTKAVIPDTVTINGVEYAVTSVAKNAFKNNKNLTTVKIGKNVTDIGDNAFAGCRKLSKVELNENLTTIGRNAFKNCKKLKTITIKSEKLTGKTIKKGAFKGISSKTVIKVPKNKLAAYKKLFRSKGLSKKVRFKKY